MNRLSRLSSFLLILVLIVTMMPMMVFADDTAKDHDVYWNIITENEDTVLLLGPSGSVGENQKVYTAEEQVSQAGNTAPPWTNQNENITVTSCRITGTICPVSTYAWFRNTNSPYTTVFNITGIDGLGNLDTSQTVNMSSMFFSNNQLSELDLSSFSTDQVEDLSCMFAFCEGLNSLDITNFDTSKAEDMNMMFYGCSNLTSLDLSSFSTLNADSVEEMFSGCSSLESINTACTADWQRNGMVSAGMFYDCKELKGGKGTVYNEDKTDAEFAHADKGSANQGYFTAKKHSWDNGVVITPASPSKEGVKSFTCSDCGDKKTEAILKIASRWANTLSVQSHSVKIKRKKLKKKAQTVSGAEAFTIIGAQGAVTYSKISVGSKKINKKYGKKFVVDPYSGNIKIKKGVKKGTYKVKTRVNASGNKDYLPTERIVTVSIRIK